jgi:predicted transposase YdaD
VDKVKTAEDIKTLNELPRNYLEEMNKKIPEHFLKIFSDCIRLLLERINAPKKEIETITEHIYTMRINNMFESINYDVQATRKQAREEGFQEGKNKGIQEGIQKGFQEASQKFESEINKLKSEIEKLKKQ